MNLRTACILILAAFTSTSSAQMVVKQYKYDYNTLSFDLEFKPQMHSVSADARGNRIISFDSYIDESKPGEAALPQYDFFVALPSYSKVSVNALPLARDKIEGIPAPNPYILLRQDSTFQYIYNSGRPLLNQNTLYSIKSNIVEIAGYLWIRDYYCVHLRLKRFLYNNSDYVESIRALHLEIRLQAPGNNLRAEEPIGRTEYDDVLSSLIINIKDAPRLDKKGCSSPISAKVQSEVNWIDFGGTYLKTGTAQDGIYRLNKKDLENYGIAASAIDPNTFKLYCKGKEIPIYVWGASDNTFDEADYIEFYGRRNMGDNYREISRAGEAYKEYLNRYSDTTIYWLTWEGSAGKRIDTISPGAHLYSDTLDYYYERAHYEENPWLDYSTDNLVRRQEPFWKENQTWVWGQQSTGTQNRIFQISDLYPGKRAKAFYKVQSFSSNITSGAHKIGLSINDDPAVYDSTAFNKYEQKVVKAEVPSNLLKNGTNVLKTISFPTMNRINSVEYDWYEVEYPRVIRCTNNKLMFQVDSSLSSGIRLIKVLDITSDDIIIYKSAPRLKRITDYFKAGNFIVFCDTVKGGDEYFVTSSELIKAPKIYYKKQFHNLASASEQADYIILTSGEFVNKAIEYSAYIKEHYNLQPKVIDVRDIYDQYNYGFFAPEPIRDFLFSANLNWNPPKPSYLFLVGDASYDYYGYKTKYFNAPSAKNYVPSFGEPVSDAWYTVWDTTGAYIPQMITGRLPVASASEFENYLQRHKSYNELPFSEFNKNYLLFSGGNSNIESELNQFRKVNSYIENELIRKRPAGGNANHFYKTYNPATNFGPYSPEQIRSMISQGGVFVSYIGHSGTQIWDNGISDAEQLNNDGGRSFLVTDFGCSTGKFAEPDIKSFSELFVAGPRGNAIGYIGNSSLGFTSTTLSFPQLFYEGILRDNIFQQGKAHTMAKIKLLNTYGSSGVYKVFALCNTLFGDPVISLKIPAKPNLIISDKDISFENKPPDESTDSIKISFRYFNYGRADSAFFTLTIDDNFQGKDVFRRQLKRLLPVLSDSLQVYIPIKGMSGSHTVEIKLDSGSEIDEIYENDNGTKLNFTVFSSQIRSVINNAVENKLNGVISIISPSHKNTDSAIIHYSSNPQFSSPKRIAQKLEPVNTRIVLPGLLQGKRYWLKTGANVTEGKELFSFIYDSVSAAYYIEDSLSFSKCSVQNLSISDSGAVLARRHTRLGVSSAGYFDGSYAIIEYNGNNVLPDGHLDGIHCAVFDGRSFSFLYSRKFDYWGSPGDFASKFCTFLDTLPPERILAMANCGGAGYGNTSAVKKAIKQYGSCFIDSVDFRYSWAMIGRKGAESGSIPEKWSRTFQGPVRVDTSFLTEIQNGFLLTKEIGPAGKWKYISADVAPNNGEINISLIGIKSSNEQDTLSVNTGNSTKYDISSIDAAAFRRIRALIKFRKNDNSPSPVLKSFTAHYESLPELAVNYQSVSLSKDTLRNGENAELKFTVYNAGESAADSFSVRVEAAKPDNSKAVIYEAPAVSVTPFDKKSFALSYNTSRSGSKAGSFIISADPKNKVNEIYKDNNCCIIPFYVLPDTTPPVLKVTFDGKDILDGQYVSSKPNIRAELSDNSLLPISDTSAITLKLNNRPVYFSSKDVKASFSESNPKAVTEYTPQLPDGEYTLRVSGKNASGNISEDVTRTFMVVNEMKLLDLYNYPNPFKDETFFTFRLTQVPEEIKIRIYTVAGRLIKNITLHHSELKNDFNFIRWDGKDEEGDVPANGVYLYKVTVKSGNKTESYLQKMAVVR